MRYLVTGGAGFIGSHTCVELLLEGHEVAVVDNFINSSHESLRRVEEFTARPLTLFQVDLLDRAALEDVFASDRFDAVVHFAGLKAVGESVEQPLRYYHNNVSGTLVLCEVMERHDVRQLVFSSSSTVYGEPQTVPITEESPLALTSPYGRCKLFIEQMLRDLAAARNWSITLLRYFNPVGAQPSGRIGEDPRGVPNNLLPFIAQVAVGRLKRLKVFGHDYDTPDGTGIRDYIHVTDLALGHLAALAHLEGKRGVSTYNLGTGRGYSVLEMIEAFSRACGRPIPYELVDRRDGDVAICYADPSLAQSELGWIADRGVEQMCADAWRWQSANPEGYASTGAG